MKAENRYSSEEVHTDLKRFDIETDVKTLEDCEGFTTHLSFIPVEWYLAEKVVANEAQCEQLDEKLRLKLTLGIFP